MHFCNLRKLHHEPTLSLNGLGLFHLKMWREGERKPIQNVLKGGLMIIQNGLIGGFSFNRNASGGGGGGGAYREIAPHVGV